MEMAEPFSCHVKMVAASPSPSNQSEELQNEAFVNYAGAGHELRPASYKPLTVSSDSECSRADTPCQFHFDEPEASNNVQSSVQNNDLVFVDTEEPIADDLVNKRILGSSLSQGKFDGHFISFASESNLDARYHCILTRKGIPCDSENDIHSKDPHEAPVDTNSLSSSRKISGCLGLAQSVGGLSSPNRKKGRILGAANIKAKSKAKNISFSLQNSLQQENYVPAKQASENDDKAAGCIEGFAELCPPNPETASEFSHRSNSSCPGQNQEKLSGMDSERVNAAETINGWNSVVLQKRNSKAFRTSRTELTTNPPFKTQSGKPGHAQRTPPAQNSKISSQAVAGSANQTVPAKKYSAKALEMSRTQTPPVTKQVWKVKEKVEASKDLSKLSLVEVSQGRGKAEPVKDSSKPSPKARPVKEKEQLSKWQVRGKTEPDKDSSISSTKVWRIKEKKQPSKDSSKLSSRRRSSNQRRSKRIACKHHITWDGFEDESNEKLGQSCRFCDNDLACLPEPPMLDLGSRNLPDVAILPCGHAFHLLCLSCSMSEEQLKDPPCIICESLS